MAQHPEASGLATVAAGEASLAYAVVVEWAGTNYAGHAPDLPGYFATGDTVEEVLDLMREGIPFHLEGLLRDGEPNPEPRTRVALIAVPRERLAHPGTAT